MSIQSKDAKKKYQFLINRNVSRLCHFTRASKALHILDSADGIQSVETIQKEILDKNDKYRYDHHEGYINCSIEYPNVWYLNKIRDIDPVFSEIVILFVSLEILLHREVKFCPCNAAYQHGSEISADYNKLVEMYADNVNYRHTLSRSHEMSSCCPTDGQAEILIKDNIPLDFISGIGVETEDSAQKMHVRGKVMQNNYPPIYITPGLFKTNCFDIIRRGKKHQELPYSFEGEVLNG